MLTLVRSTALKANWRPFATKCKRNPRKPGPKIDATAASLAAKGFLRPQKQYTPPENLQTQLAEVFKRVVGTSEGKTRIDDFQKRFELFLACEEQLQHKIPSSLLHKIERLEDVCAFYSTPVDTITPLENLRNLELPKNLHVQYEYHRFHPETDTKFGGVTAFPGSSTVVTGLKYKDKYRGHQQKLQSPHII